MYKFSLFQRASISSRDSNNCSMDDLRTRVAVRFFVRKSKRFDQYKENIQQKPSQTFLKPKSGPDCLMYLGLVPRKEATHSLHDKSEKKGLDFQFKKPRLHDCPYCNKIFLHKLLFRRHMINHLNKIHCCRKCRQGFGNKITKRRHEMGCRY